MTIAADLTFPFCPEPPHWSLDWQNIEGAFEPVRNLAGCPQDPSYHAEGDVLTHTRLVCESLAQNQRWRKLTPVERSRVFAATLLHDVAKPVCTKEVAGRITSRGHSLKGAQMARELIWELWPGLSSPAFFRMRESIVGLVRHHGLPLYFLERSDPQRTAIEASMTARLDWVAILAEADVRGRICTDLNELLDRVAMFGECAAETGCADRPFPFPDAETRIRYFRKPGLPADVPCYDATKFEVILLSGLPASGKDTWLRESQRHLPVVSLDDLREELGVSPADNQGRTANEARERAKDYLREQQPFAWNATNTTRLLRRQLIDLFRDYGARVKIVYVETSVEEQRRRNRARPRPVPENIVATLRRRLDVPDLTEAQSLEIVTT